MAAKKLVTLKEAIELVNQAHNIDPEKDGKTALSAQTIYNAINTKKMKRYGPRHILQVNVDELLKVFGPKKAC